MDIRVAMIVFMRLGGIIFPYSHYLMCKLKEQGVDVALWGNTGLELPDRLQVPYKSQLVFHRLRNFAPDLYKAYRGIAGSGADIVHFQHSTSPLPELMFTWAAHRKGMKVVFTAHDVLPHQVRLQDRAYFGALYRSVDAVIVHAEQNRKTALELGVPASRVHVVPLGDFMHYDVPDAPARDQALQRLGYAPGAKVALFFGAIRPDKGLDVLIRAFKQVADAEPDARLLCVGPVKGDAEKAESFYADIVDSLDLGDRVDLRFGYAPDEEVPVYFAASTVVVLPYRESTQSGVVQVAFATRRAVVASAVGGIPEVIDDGVTGRLVESGNTTQLADAVLHYLGDQAGADEAGRQGYQKARREYSWDIVAEKTIGIYKSVLGR